MMTFPITASVNNNEIDMHAVSMTKWHADSTAVEVTLLITLSNHQSAIKFGNGCKASIDDNHTVQAQSIFYSHSQAKLWTPAH
jgi:hypothetical protein